MSVCLYEVPSTGTLLAFEAAARLGTITRAAEERATSNSAISRHIRQLEETLGVVLFERRSRGVALTESGRTFFLAVRTGLEIMHETTQQLRGGQVSLNIGCTLEFSELLLQPVLSELDRALGEAVAARIVVHDRASLPILIVSGLDIVFETSHGAGTAPDAVPVLDEKIVPVASPGFMERFAAVLAGHPLGWRDVPRLAVRRQCPDWATWQSWFEANGCAAPPAPVKTLRNDLDMLRAAAQGEGLAIGWNGFMSDYFETGRLVAARKAWLATGVTIYGVPTPTGRRKGATAACLEELPGLIADLCTRSPVTM